MKKFYFFLHLFFLIEAEIYINSCILINFYQ